MAVNHPPGIEAVFCNSRYNISLIQSVNCCSAEALE